MPGETALSQAENNSKWHCLYRETEVPGLTYDVTYSHALSIIYFGKQQQINSSVCQGGIISTLNPFVYQYCQQQGWQEIYNNPELWFDISFSSKDSSSVARFLITNSTVVRQNFGFCLCRLQWKVRKNIMVSICFAQEARTEWKQSR